MIKKRINLVSKLTERRRGGRNTLACIVMDGVKRPDMDLRWVTRATMADYLGISAGTLSRWVVEGLVPKNAIKSFGKNVRYMPAKFMPAVEPVKA